MKQDFVSRWFRGETRWNAPVCLVVAVMCAGTTALLAVVLPNSQLVWFNGVCAMFNLACSFLFRTRYRAWLAEHGPEVSKSR